jgi:hypothetical protein
MGCGIGFDAVPDFVGAISHGARFGDRLKSSVPIGEAKACPYGGTRPKNEE